MDIFKLPEGMTPPRPLKWNIPEWSDDVDEDEEIAMGRQMMVKVAPTPELENRMNQLLDDAKAHIARVTTPDDAQIDAALASLDASFPGVFDGYNESYRRDAIQQALSAARKGLVGGE